MRHFPESIRPVSILSLALLLAVSATASAGGTRHYVELVNTAQDSITSLSVASAGSSHFRAIPIDGAALHGGGESMTMAVAAAANGAGCLQDLRIGFANGRTLIQKNFDVCKYRSYHTGRYLRGHAQTVVASVP